MRRRVDGMRKRKLYKAAAVMLSVLLAGGAACGQKTGAGTEPTVQAGDGGADKSQTGDTENPGKGTDEPNVSQTPEGGTDKENGAAKGDSAETVVKPGADAANTDVAAGTTISGELKRMIDAIKTADIPTKESKASIVLSDAGISVDGGGCKVDGSTVKIKEAGTYTVSGSLSNGMIYVNPDDEGEVVLILNGISVHNETGAAIHCKKASKVTVVLADGTENVLSDGTSYVFEEGETEPDAVLFAKHDLVITGTGRLTINANYGDALKGKDALYLLGGSIAVNAADDGIVGRDLLYVAGGSYTVVSKGDAMKSTNDKDAALGMIVIDGGQFVLTSEKDAVQAENTLFIQGGTFEIKTGKGADGAAVKTDDFGGFGRGGWNGNKQQTQAAAEEESLKGLKGGVAVVVSGGSFVMDTGDDAVHSNSTVGIFGGNFQITSGDDGIHADEELTVAGNSVITIAKCYEGLEAKTITINGGTVDVTAGDDGINAAGGADQSGFGGRGMFASGSGQLTINGGSVTVNAVGDGLDSNGSITMNGGTVIVYGPTNDGNGALDYDGTFALNGGSILCIGSRGMAQAASASSKQYSLAAGLTQAAVAGSTVEIRVDGQTVFQTTSAKQFSHIVASSADFSKDAAVVVLINGAEVFSGTLTSVVTNFGNTAGGFGTGGKGGMGSRPNRGELPDMGDVPDWGNMPDKGDFPDRRKMPDRGDMPDWGNMPDRGTRPEMGNPPEDGWNPAGRLPEDIV